jgi:hypothetical protein
MYLWPPLLNAHLFAETGQGPDATPRCPSCLRVRTTQPGPITPHESAHLRQPRRGDEAAAPLCADEICSPFLSSRAAKPARDLLGDCRTPRRHSRDAPPVVIPHLASAGWGISYGAGRPPLPKSPQSKTVRWAVACPYGTGSAPPPRPRTLNDFGLPMCTAAPSAKGIINQQSAISNRPMPQSPPPANAGAGCAGMTTNRERDPSARRCSSRTLVRG